MPITAMILAAGRGERLRPLTDTTPKPLIEVGGIPLIVRHIEALKEAGITDIVVNSAWLSDKIVKFLGNGSRFNVHITHSVEGPGGLETAGGIIKALPYLSDTFLVVNGDTYMDVSYAKFLQRKLPHNICARLYLVKNPAHNLKGDFALGEDGLVQYGNSYTFSGTALYRKSAFADMDVCRLKLRPLFDKWIAASALQGCVFDEPWFDAGTIERLNIINEYIKNRG